MEYRLGGSTVLINASSSGGLLDVEVRFVGGGVQQAVPAVYVVLLDTSRSMTEFGKLEQALWALSSLVNSLDPQDWVAVYTFDDKVKKAIPMTTAWEARSRLQKLKVKPGNYTLLFEALLSAVEELKKMGQGALKRVIVITDGEPWPTYTDVSYYESLGRYAFRHGISISALGVGDAYNEKVLYALASNSGGTWYHVSAPDAISQLLLREAKRAKSVALRRPRAGVRNCEVVDVKKIGATVASLPPSSEVELEDVAAGEVVSVVFRVRPTGQVVAWAEAEGQRVEEAVSPAVEEKTALLVYQFADALQKAAAGGELKTEVLREVTRTAVLPEAWREKAERLLQKGEGPRDKDFLAEATTVIYVRDAGEETAVYQAPATSAHGGGGFECEVVNVKTGASMPIGDTALLGRDDFASIADREVLKYVSRRIGVRAHIEVVVRGGEVYVRDAGSSGGTYVNGKRIGSDFVKVGPDDVISLGRALDIKIRCRPRGA